MYRKILTFLALISLAANAAAFSDNHHSDKHHQLGIFAGETSANSEKEFTYALEYEYKFDKNYGFGVTLENVNGAHEDIRVSVASLYYHPTSNFRLGIGYGREKAEGHDSESLVRYSLAYDFHINESMTFGPTFALDKIDGHTSRVYGLALNFLF